MVAKKNSADTKAGPPRWTYAAGSIVAIGGLVWGIVSYFIPKPVPTSEKTSAVPSVSQQTTAESGSTAVTATGSATVVIGGSLPSSASTSAPSMVAPIGASQSARAASAGTAVNAGDSARVSVNK